MNENPVSMPPGLVNRAKAMIMTPKTEWPVVAIEPSSIADIYKSYVIWLAAIGPIASVIGQFLFPIRVLGIGFVLSPGFIIGSAVTSYVLSLITVYIMALVIDWLAPQFGGTKSPLSAFKVAAYAMTASWLAGIFGIFPPIAVLSLLGLYSFYLLYLGLPVLMKVPADKAVAYTVVSILVCIVIYWIIFAIAGGITYRMFAPTTPILTM